MQTSLPLDRLSLETESESYLREQLITYIGNKRALLPFIGRAVHQVRQIIGEQRIRTADIFSGTGVVARLLKQYSSHILANDLETYSSITNNCYLRNQSETDWARLQGVLQDISSRIESDLSAGWITELYAPKNDDAIEMGERVFYTRGNAVYLDTAMRAIHGLDEPWRTMLLAPLIAKASVHANTSGVFKGFYKDRDGRGKFGGHGADALKRILRPIKIELPLTSRFHCDYTVTKSDANELARSISWSDVDLVYLDPPYNQHPYGSNYFMLNLIAENRRPENLSEVSGIPAEWNRSPYNKRRHASTALFELIESCKCPFILVSYNSEGFIEKETFMEEMGRLGKLSVMETPYNTFRGSRNLRERPIHVTEYLFLLDKR